MRRIDDQSIRKLTKVGQHSISVTIPIEFVRKLKWREKQKVVVSMRGKSLTIKDWEK